MISSLDKPPGAPEPASLHHGERIVQIAPGGSAEIDCSVRHEHLCYWAANHVEPDSAFVGTYRTR